MISSDSPSDIAPVSDPSNEWSSDWSNDWVRSTWFSAFSLVTSVSSSPTRRRNRATSAMRRGSGPPTWPRIAFAIEGRPFLGVSRPLLSSAGPWNAWGALKGDTPVTNRSRRGHDHCLRVTRMDYRFWLVVDHRQSRSDCERRGGRWHRRQTKDDRFMNLSLRIGAPQRRHGWSSRP